MYIEANVEDCLPKKRRDQSAPGSCKPLEIDAPKYVQVRIVANEVANEDRNRTAPFPFCGNRFEFRAVGSSQNCCFLSTQSGCPHSLHLLRNILPNVAVEGVSS